MMWWSGLRGAMAFSLAILAVERYGADGEVMRSCTFYMVRVFHLILGCRFKMHGAELNELTRASTQHPQT